MPKARMLQFLEQPPFARTHPSARSVLAPEPLNGTNGTRYRVAVVGNGPLHEEDRPRIDAYRNVIRFNDAKNLRPGERTTVHVHPYDHERLRSPQASAHSHLWGIHNRWQHATQRHNYSVVTLNYQSYEDDVPALDWKRLFTGHGPRLPQTLGPWGKTTRIFEGCTNCNGDRCLLSNGWLGLSAGGLVIEALNALDDPPLEEIAVFGMNWQGEVGHTDFRDPTLVPDCCARCVIHATASGTYLPPDYPTRTEQRLQDLSVAVPLMTFALCIVGALLAWANRRRYHVHGYRGHRRHHDEPSQPPGPPPPTQEPAEIPLEQQDASL